MSASESTHSSYSLQSEDPEKNPTYLALKNFWHPVCYANELRDEPKQITLFNQNICVSRIGAEVVAFEDRCCHKGAALSLGTITDAQTIQCHYHGWEYDVSGKIVKIPAREEFVASIKRTLKKYHAKESTGLIWVCIAENPKYPVPDFPEFSDPDYKVLQGEAYDWATSTPRRLENFVDFAHFAFVHPDSIGTPDHARVEAVKIWREGGVLRFDRSGIPEPSTPAKKKLMGIEDMELIEAVNTYHVTMPHTVHLKRDFPRGARYVLLMSVSPISATQARSFWFQARDFGMDEIHDKFFMDYEKHVLAQDKPIIESQRPIQIYFSGELARQELPLAHADAVTIEYRRWLHELTREFENDH
ncbi:aromatic ring-hydroxylating dioxygenase subunit alpha [Comamonas sp. SCN 65-56]|uniref:aromatic ring-hydroxylating oxygenase subunit alpha n=1 Tax=Comamonas sp. SCN 65-56 TaxID=1660095 RepID=UPI000B02DCB6|nr:aromatic ring-hydroxylating dioxygenase subunit alpha [Comamonas sp. SCN 65-56]